MCFLKLPEIFSYTVSWKYTNISPTSHNMSFTSVFELTQKKTFSTKNFIFHQKLVLLKTIFIWKLSQTSEKFSYKGKFSFVRASFWTMSNPSCNIWWPMMHMFWQQNRDLQKILFTVNEIQSHHNSKICDLIDLKWIFGNTFAFELVSIPTKPSQPTKRAISHSHPIKTVLKNFNTLIRSNLVHQFKFFRV